MKQRVQFMNRLEEVIVRGETNWYKDFHDGHSSQMLTVEYEKQVQPIEAHAPVFLFVDIFSMPNIDNGNNDLFVFDQR